MQVGCGAHLTASGWRRESAYRYLFEPHGAWLKNSLLVRRRPRDPAGRGAPAATDSRLRDHGAPCRRRLLPCGHESYWYKRRRGCHPQSPPPHREPPPRFGAQEAVCCRGAPSKRSMATTVSLRSRPMTGRPSAPAARRSDAWLCATAAETSGSAAGEPRKWNSRGAPQPRGLGMFETRRRQRD